MRHTAHGVCLLRWLRPEAALGDSYEKNYPEAWRGLPMVIDRIGDGEEGKPVEILFGALAMQQWGIRPLPDQEKLDMLHYPKEFLEFLVGESHTKRDNLDQVTSRPICSR